MRVSHENVCMYVYLCVLAVVLFVNLSEIDQQVYKHKSRECLCADVCVGVRLMTDRRTTKPRPIQEYKSCVCERECVCELMCGL